MWLWLWRRLASTPAAPATSARLLIRITHCGTHDGHEEARGFALQLLNCASRRSDLPPLTVECAAPSPPAATRLVAGLLNAVALVALAAWLTDQLMTLPEDLQSPIRRYAIATGAAAVAGGSMLVRLPFFRSDDGRFNVQLYEGDDGAPPSLLWSRLPGAGASAGASEAGRRLPSVEAVCEMLPGERRRAEQRGRGSGDDVREGSRIGGGARQEGPLVEDLGDGLGAELEWARQRHAVEEAARERRRPSSHSPRHGALRWPE